MTYKILTADEWISVDDQLPPEFTQTVLVARDINSPVPAVMAAFFDGEEFISCSIAGNQVFKDPTHWTTFPGWPGFGED